MSAMGDLFPSRQSSSASRRQSDDERPSSRFPRSLSLENDFDMEQFGISDGFAPPSTADISARAQHLSSDRPSTRRSLSLTQSTNAPPSRSSTYKQSRQQGGRSSFALGHDGPGNHIPRRAPSMAASTTSNETHSTDSTFVLPAHTPFQGPSGPTHPYAMYPQGTGISSRPSSVMTTSTVRMPERAFTGANGPTHPYGMYPQSAVPEVTESEQSVPVLSFPVGFPGLGQSYQRRLGPDGEEAADIIGPDGHTEQLPPYSRFPTDIRLKGHSPAHSEAGTRSTGTPSTAVPEYDPNHSQASLNLNVQQSRLSTRSFMSESSEARLRPTETSGSDNSGSFKEKLSAKGKKRVCCGKVPLWCLLAVAIALCVLFLGGIIGGTMAKRHIQEDMEAAAQNSAAASMTFVATVTTTIEASPMTVTPSNLPPLPTGRFALPAQEQPGCTSACLKSSKANNTWGCRASSGRFQDLQLQIIPDQGGMVQLTTTDHGTNASLKYGAQAPVFGNAQKPTLVMDNDDMSKGPAFHFGVIYDKLVILRDTDFVPDTVAVRDFSERDAQSPPAWWPAGKRFPTDALASSPGSAYGSSTPRKSAVQPGDHLWFCWWNSTILEGYIYTGVNISPDTTSNDTSLDSSSTSTAGSAAATATIYPIFPNVVKITEFRNPGISSYVGAYCQKMQVHNNNEVVAAWDSQGRPVTFAVNEWKPNDGISSGSRLVRRNWYDDIFETLKRRGGPAPPFCRCQWMSL